MPAGAERSPPDPQAAPVTALRGVGARVAERLGRLGVRSVQDLLFHLPLRYEDRTRVVPVGSLRPGDSAVILVQVRLSQVRHGRRRSLMTLVSDGTGSVHLRFFHFSAAQQAALSPGARLRCFGEVRSGPSGLEMVHPEYSRVDGEEPAQMQAHLTPVYPSTEGLHQLSLRRLTDQALEHMRGAPPADLLPESVRRRLRLPPLAEAIALVHRPPPHSSLRELDNGRHPAQQRLAFEELLAHHLSLRVLRARVQREPAPSLEAPGELGRALLASLGFELTGAQRRVAAEIARDLRASHPMQRLIQGDVGSGKTVVAALAAAQAVEAGFQVAVMAPTEVLAEQHQQTFGAWLEPLGVPTAWLSGRVGRRERRRTLERIASGQAAVAIGTHALFQDEVRFAELGLVVVDEQHRFGVHQRLALREKGCRDGRHPHQLIMTATPIPRTLAMAAYADLDTSVIDELPPGRTPVQTIALADTRREEVVQRIARVCGEGRQAYWVCTLIDESEALQAQAASDTAEHLRASLPGLRVSLVHGRMKGAEKQAVMSAFKSGTVDLLVATTVIEVGVDVPRASLMIIENAERLGLAQLHQLRGRVGRGGTRSHCVLMYHPPLSAPARERLQALREDTNGFNIAYKDMELRGPGEVLGTRQTGMLQLRIADLLRDADLFPAVDRAARELLEQHPQRVPALLQRWLGNAVDYAHV